MADRIEDLHGNAPDKCPVALLMIDVLNDLEFEGGDELLENALPMAHALAALRERATGAGIPVVYVNDNFGKWRSDFHQQLQHCLNDGVRGEPVVRLLAPGKDDYFVLKPKHSGFYHTTLDLLLEYLQVRTVILAGLATNSCVLFTASDAYMRDLQVIIPADCVAAQDEDLHEAALAQMRDVLKADTRDSSKLNLDAILAGAREHAGRRSARQPGALTTGVHEHQSRDAGHTNS